MSGQAEIGTKGWLERDGLRRMAVAVVVLLHVGLTFFSVRHKSATSDEPYHLARGVSTLFSGDFRMAEAHPPLINVITALPLLFFPDLQVPFGSPAADITFWYNPQIDPVVRKNNFFKFLLWIHDAPGWRGNPDPRAMIFWCRTPVMAMSALLALALYGWTARSVGPRAGFMALGLYSFSPTVIAQAGLITTDVGGSLAIFGFAVALAWHLEAPSWKRLGLVGLCFGIAQLSKHTAILLFPLVPAAFLLAASGSWRDRLKNFFTVKPGRAEFQTGLAAWVIIILIGMFVIWAGYGFEVHSFHHFQVPAADPVTRFRPWLAEHIIRTMSWLPLLPRTYYYGLGRTLFDTTQHPVPLYFMGRESASGWWYYYPVMFVIKEPIALLGLVVLAAVFLFRQKALPKPERTVGLVLSVGIMVFFMFMNQKNIGLRHVLPVYPLVFMFMSGLVEPRIVARAWARRAGWGLLGIYAANAFLSYPDYLVHFNYLVGGPDGGLRYSVVGDDWGQDVWALGDYCRENNIEVMHYNVYGNSDPAAYGVPAKKFNCDGALEPGWYAVNVVYLRRPPEGVGPECVRQFIQGKPVAVLHHTIYIYKIK